MIHLIDCYEATRGIYRYAIAENLCYEIHILTWDHKTDILSANACLYIVGDCETIDGRIRFQREQLYRGTLAACLEVATEDYKNNWGLNKGCI